MQASLFRMYDIRGLVGSEFILKDTYRLGRAIATCLQRKSSSVKTVTLSMDARIHSPEIKEQLLKAFLDSGLDVIDIGLCPTPLLYFSQYQLPVQAGIMVTASHNPQNYNGIKMVIHKEPFFGNEIQAIYQTFLEQNFIESETKGTVTMHDMVADYVAYMAQEFSFLQGLTRHVVIDCGKGAAATVVPELVKKMEWHNAILLCADTDQSNRKHDADPSVETNIIDLKEEVEKYPDAIGIAFDGDADRMGAVTEEGDLVAGDKLLGIFAQQILKKEKGAQVVCDGKCSSGLKELVESAGGTIVISKTGHAFMKEKIKKTHAAVAGELSCHFFFNDRYFGYDDGIYAGLRLVEILELTQKTLTALVANFPVRVSSPELRISCLDKEGAEIVKHAYNYFLSDKDAQINTLDGIRVEKKYGWGLLRSSHTQSVVCLRLEATSEQGLDQIKRDFMQALSLSYPQEYLEREITW